MCTTYLCATRRASTQTTWETVELLVSTGRLPRMHFTLAYYMGNANEGRSGEDVVVVEGKDDTERCRCGATVFVRVMRT